MVQASQVALSVDTSWHDKHNDTSHTASYNPSTVIDENVFVTYDDVIYDDVTGPARGHRIAVALDLLPNYIWIITDS